MSFCHGSVKCVRGEFGVEVNGRRSKGWDVLGQARKHEWMKMKGIVGG